MTHTEYKMVNAVFLLTKLSIALEGLYIGLSSDSFLWLIVGVGLVWIGVSATFTLTLGRQKSIFGVFDGFAVNRKNST